VTAPLGAMFAAHKPVVLGVAAAGVVGLALLKKKGAGSSSSSTSSPAGTIPATGVVSSGSVQGTYPDTTATDVYNSLQPTLAQILNQQANQTSAGNSHPLSAPKPIASTLFAPQGTGNYVFLQNANTIGEVESDGSIYGIGGGEGYSGPTNPAQLSQLQSAPSGSYFTKADNLKNAAASFSATP
jgi:hypothetical protein